MDEQTERLILTALLLLFEADYKLRPAHVIEADKRFVDIMDEIRESLEKN